MELEIGSCKRMILLNKLNAHSLSLIMRQLQNGIDLTSRHGYTEGKSGQHFSVRGRICR